MLRVQVFWARVQHLVGFFSNTLKNAAEDGETFLEGCEYVWEDLLFVDPLAMSLILQIFARVFKKMKNIVFDSDLAINLFLQTQEVCNLLSLHSLHPPRVRCLATLVRSELSPDNDGGRACRTCTGSPACSRIIPVTKTKTALLPSMGQALIAIQRVQAHADAAPATHLTLSGLVWPALLGKPG